MSYYYMNHLRCQLWFDSPNHCAAFLVMSTLLSIGFFIFFTQRNRVVDKIGAVFFFVLVVMQEYFLVLTYSRGGYLALSLSLLLAWFACKKKRLAILFFIFIAILLITANGVDRVQSFVATGDGSIKHRGLLWLGSLSIIWNHMFTGAGADTIGAFYTAWYQPLWLNEHYSTMISDYLTIAAAYGIFALFGYFTLIFTVLYLGFKLWRESKNVLLLFLLAALAAYLISAVFTTFYCHWKVYWCFVTLFFVLILLIVNAIRKDMLKLSLRNIGLPWAGSAVLCLILLLGGFWVNRSVPYDVKTTVLKVGNNTLKLEKAYPRTRPKAIIVHAFCSDDNTCEDAVRALARPLLLRGYAVMTAGGDSGMDGLACIEAAVKEASVEANKMGIALLLTGQGNGGRHVIVAAAQPACPKLNAVVAIDAPASWPFEKLSPDKHLRNLKAPLCLIYFKSEKTYSSDEVEGIKKICNKNKISLNLNVFDTSTGKSDKIVELIDKTF